uniref:(northern house mosquito) hypothetical protein n=1 Tax=Culex pipiens TaxID=7175 RepID=A0A8D8KYH5_CULPI
MEDRRIAGRHRIQMLAAASPGSCTSSSVASCPRAPYSRSSSTTYDGTAADCWQPRSANLRRLACTYNEPSVRFVMSCSVRMFPPLPIILAPLQTLVEVGPAPVRKSMFKLVECS